MALALGWVILRLRGVYFVLVTFAFGELLRLALLDGAALTGGANGIAGIAPAEILGYAFDSRGRYYPGAGRGAAVHLGAGRAVPAPAGTRHRRGGGQPALAESTGLNVHRIQLLAFVCGCLLAAAGGALQSRYIGYVSPESFNTSISVGFIIMLVIGGRRSVWGRWWAPWY